MSENMYYLLADVLIALLLAIEVYCGYQLKKELKKRSEERTEARRAATRPSAYKAVHESWAVYRNRNDLWEKIEK
jgi:hypothetical protein